MLFSCFTLFSMSLSYWSLRVILLDKPIIAKWMMLKDLLWVYGKLETESGIKSRTFDEFQIKVKTLDNMPWPNLLIDNLYSKGYGQYFTATNQAAW